jgi:hypothetical protein
MQPDSFIGSLLTKAGKVVAKDALEVLNLGKLEGGCEPDWTPDLQKMAISIFEDIKQCFKDGADMSTLDWDTRTKELAECIILLQAALKKESTSQTAYSNLELMDRKNHDYGSKNVGEFGELGVVVRMTDKVNRIKNLSTRGVSLVLDETVHDTWGDLFNYTLILRAIKRGDWPNE